MRSSDERFESRWSDFPAQEVPSSLQLSGDLSSHIERETQVLDVGCGSANAALQLCSWGVQRYIGLDLNEAVLRKAAGTLSRIQCQSILLVGDARALPIADACFDLVILQALLTVVIDPKDRNTILREAHRVLAPGGTLYVSEFLQTWSSPKYRGRYLEGLRETGRRGTFPVRNDLTGEVEYYAHHFSIEGLLSELRDAGFTLRTNRTNPVRTRSGSVVAGVVALAGRGQDI